MKDELFREKMPEQKTEVSQHQDCRWNGDRNVYHSGQPRPVVFQHNFGTVVGPMTKAENKGPFSGAKSFTGMLNGWPIEKE